MYMNATSKDLRYKTKAILQAVAAGKQVVIPHRGVPKAVIRAITKSAAVDIPLADEDCVTGMWAEREDIDDVAQHVRNLRRGSMPAIGREV